MSNPLSNPLIAIVFGCCLCSVISTSASFCPDPMKNACYSGAGLVNCIICIYVLYILATGGKTKSD